MLDSIMHVCQNYVDQMPIEEGLRAACLGATISFIASHILMADPISKTPNFSRAGIAAGLSLLSSAIYILTKPIFNYMFDHYQNDMHPDKEFTALLINTAFTQICVNHFTAVQVNFYGNSVIPNLHNFIGMPSNIIRLGINIAARILSYIDPNAPGIMNKFCSHVGVDIYSGAPPFYLMI